MKTKKELLEFEAKLNKEVIGFVIEIELANYQVEKLKDLDLSESLNVKVPYGRLEMVKRPFPYTPLEKDYLIQISKGPVHGKYVILGYINKNDLVSYRRIKLSPMPYKTAERPLPSVIDLPKEAAYPKAVTELPNETFYAS